MEGAASNLEMKPKDLMIILNDFYNTFRLQGFLRLSFCDIENSTFFLIYLFGQIK